MATCLHPIFLREQGSYVPCGKCPNCTQNKRQSLADRFMLESAFSKRTYFCTLTYDDDHLPWCQIPGTYTGEWFPCFYKPHLQQFQHYLRRNLNAAGKLRFFFTAEYGDKGHRPHYHCLIWSDLPIGPISMTDAVDKSWIYGNIDCQTACDASIAYCAKYVLKDSLHEKSLNLIDRTEVRPFKDVVYEYNCRTWDCRKSFSIYSNGIGQNAISFIDNYVFNEGKLRPRFTFSGKPVTLHRYFKDHMDPSLKEEIKAAMDMQEYQENLQKSKKCHSFVDVFGNMSPDYSEDIRIMKRRYALNQLKKQRL